MKPLIILLLTALPTFARLGETRAECETRYGKPVKTTDKGSTLYLKADLVIEIFFWKDKATRLCIGKPQAGVPGIDVADPKSEKRDPLSRAELDVLLKANSGNSEWKEQGEDENPFADISWDRTDGNASAFYSGKQWVVFNPKAEEEQSAEMDKQEAEILKAFGGLGETRAECDKRYGKPVKELGIDILYHKPGFDISIGFWKGKAVSILFIPLPRGSDPDAEGFLLEHERDALLKANGQNLKWEEDEDNEDLHKIVWYRSDEKAMAIYKSKENHTLLILDREYLKQQSQEKEKKAAEDLDGF